MTARDSHDDVTERAYLEEVRREVAAIDPAQADGIVAELAEHLREARADAAERGEPFDLDAALSELGDPAVIAAAVERPVGAVSGAARPAEGGAVRRFLDSAAGVAFTLVLIGLPVLLAAWGLVAGILMLWGSRRWRLGDKLFATLAIPVTAVLFLVVLRGTGFMYLWSALVVAPPTLAGILLLRLRRSAVDDRRVLEIPRAPRFDTPRTGVLGVADRWPGATVAVLASPVAVAMVVVPTLVARDWSALPVTAWLAGAVLLLGAIEVVVSRGWSPVERILGIFATGAAGAALAGVVGALYGATPAVRSCTGNICVDMARGLGEPITLLDPVVSFVLPFVLLATGWTAARFRSSHERPDALDGRSAAIAAAAGQLCGAVAVTAWFGLRAAIAAGTPTPGAVVALHNLDPATVVWAWSAVAGSALWLVGVVVLLRSRRWGSSDRLLGSISVPVLWACVLLMVDSGSGGGRYYRVDPSLPGGLPLAEAWPVALAIAAAVQLAIAVRLFVARRR